MAEYIAVKVDQEHVAEAWWDALRERFPSFARSLEKNDCAVIAAPLWDALAALPGFEDGPEHAQDALIDCGSEGDAYLDVVSGRHSCFDALS